MISELPNAKEILSDEEYITYLKLVGKIETSKTNADKSLGVFTEDYMKYVNGYGAPAYIESIVLTLRYLKEILGEEILFSDISISDAEDVLSLLSLRAPKGFYIYMKNLKIAFNWGVKFGYSRSKKNVFELISLPKKPEDFPSYITRDQLDSVVLNTKNEIYKTIFQFAFFTGCRRGEIHNLRWNSIDFDKKTITVGDKTFHTKSRKQRIIPMCDELFNILSKFSKSRKKFIKTNGYVFTKPDGFRFYKDTASKNFKKVVRAMGLDDDLKFHSLRHSFASFLVQNGVALYEVQKLLGHSSIRVTENYAHMNQETLRKAVSVFN